MTVVAVTSSRTSPGATSLATGLALVWSNRFDRSLLVEADPSGGVMALRFGLNASPSLTTFGSDVRNGFSTDSLWANTQELRGAHCMTSPVDPRLAEPWIERIVPTLVEQLPHLGSPTVVDLGWVGEGSASLPLVAAADTTLVVTRPEIAEIQALLFQVRRLQALGSSVALVTVGSKPNDPAEVAHLAGIPLAAVLPDDPLMAVALTGAKVAPRKLRRSLLWRTIASLADAVLDPVAMAERHHDVATPPPIPDTPTSRVPASPPPPQLAAVTPPPSDPDVPVDETAWNPNLTVELGALGTAAPAATPVAAATPTEHPDLPGGPTSEITPVMHARLAAVDGSLQWLTTDGPTSVGRHRGCDVVISDPRVSRRHGCFELGEFGWRYRDLESSNGTRCNGYRITDVVLSHGDELRFGNTVLRFELGPFGGAGAMSLGAAATPPNPPASDPEMERT